MLEKFIRLLPDNIVINLANFGRIAYRGTKRKTLLNSPSLASLLGVLFYSLFLYPSNWLVYCFALAPLIYIGGIVCDEASKRLGSEDPYEIVLDEFIGGIVAFMGLNSTIELSGSWAWLIFVSGFLLFRLLDKIKPFGIRKLEKIPTWGILADDIVAGLLTAVLLNVIGTPLLIWFLNVLNLPF